ncbi:MAG: cation:proton antiporter [Parachlamydiaceae bacterium]|nr:cation:proton antiporter [Parachlamydiaceae bacterium]
MEFLLFKDLLTLLALSIFILLIGYRLRIPPVVGFILTGVLSGPHGLGLVHDVDDVDNLAQIGIVLLLFGIGMEFSLKKLVQIKRLFLLGGSLQVGLTILFSFIAGMGLGRPWGESIFLGCLLSMSSTAIVLRILEQKGETASPQGKLSISILIFQDLIAIPMILTTPFLGSGQGTESGNESSLWLLVMGIGIMAIVFLSAQRLVPRLLFLVARTRNKELFLLSVLALCFGVAWLTSSLGLSLTIGAFLAGLIISESEYSNEAIGHIFPFQALFISFFFISVGMLLDLNFVFQQPFTIIGLAAVILLLKTFTGGLATVLLGMPMRTAVLVGIGLSQIGEFSFVLAKTGVNFGLGSDYYYQLFLAVALFTLAVSPMFINASGWIANFISSLPLPVKLKDGYKTAPQEQAHALTNHIIIIGFGISGKNLARSSKLSGIPYTILEMNPDTVKEQRRDGEPIHFGDATNIHVLEHSNLSEAKAIAVLINDPLAARRIVQVARQANPSVYIIVRARYVQEMPLYINLGADEVIPDEFGTSIEIFSRVMKQYYVPQDEIEKFINDIRSEGYEKLREHNNSSNLSDMKLTLSGMEVHSFRIGTPSSLVGKKLNESDLRKSFGMTVLLIRRESEVIANPSPETILMANDIVVVVGNKTPTIELKELFGKMEFVPATS